MTSDLGQSLLSGMTRVCYHAYLQKTLELCPRVCPEATVPGELARNLSAHGFSLPWASGSCTIQVECSHTPGFHKDSHSRPLLLDRKSAEAKGYKGLKSLHVAQAPTQHGAYLSL